MGHDYDCYFARQGDVAELKTPFVRGRETTLVEMPISWSLDDYPHFEYMRLPNGSVMPGLMNATNVLENFVDDFTYMTRVQPDFGILTYTFHPHVIGRGHRMMMLERLIQKLMEGGAVFMTMEAAMHEWLARRTTRKAAAGVRSSGGQTVEPGGGAAEHGVMGVCRQKRRRGLAPALVVARQRDDRPVAAPHQAIRPERREQVIDVGTQIVDPPVRPRFGDQARYLAAPGRLARQSRHVIGPRSQDAVGDVRLGGMIDDNRQIGMALGKLADDSEGGAA